MRKNILNKNLFLIIVTSIMLGLLIANPKLAINSVLDGIKLWFYNVMPSLFPFMIFSNILLQLNAAYILQLLFNKIMNKLFNISGSGILAIVMGYLSGYPLGSKLVCDLRKEDVISLNESYKLLAMCSTTGPAFIIGIVSIQMFDNLSIVPILLVSNYLGGFLNALLFRHFYKETLSLYSYKKSENKSFSVILNSSIVESIQSILKIGGYMVFFNILIYYLDATNVLDIFTNFFTNYLNTFHLSDGLIKGCFYGLFEITLGINVISKCSDPLIIKVAITAFIIAWSGLSIHMQTNSFLMETDIKYSRFLFGKTTQSVLSMGIAIITFKILYPTTLSIYKSFDIIKNFENFNYATFYYESMAVLALVTVFLFIMKMRRKN